jgi:YVTN family beta-propeller protein
VIDLVTNTVIGAPIPVGAQPYGLAINPAGTFAYVTSTADGTVTVVDLRSNTVLGDPIRVGNGPFSVAVNPAGTFAYVPNAADGTVSVIRLSDNTVLPATISVGHGPVSVAINPAGTFAYVVNNDDETVSVIALDQPAAGSAVIPIPAVPDVMQAVGRPATGCATYISTGSVHKGNVAGTGWNPSWAQWANGGLGGDVCVRMLGYNMTTSAWFIR